MSEATSRRKKYRVSIHWHTFALPRLNVEGPLGSGKGCHSSLGQETFGFSFPKKVIILKDIQEVLHTETMFKNTV